MTKCLEYYDTINVEIFLNVKRHAPNHRYHQESMRWKQVTYKYNYLYFHDTKFFIHLIVWLDLLTHFSFGLICKSTLSIERSSSLDLKNNIHIECSNLICNTHAMF